jgi:hypothetical protein
MVLLAQLKALTVQYNRPPGGQRRSAAINIEYSSTIKEKLVQKRKFRKL